MAFVYFISVLKFFKYMRLNRKMNFLWRVMDLAFWEIVAFMAIMLIIFLAFASYGVTIFGAYSRSFHNLPTSMMTLFQMSIGDIGSADYEDLKKADSAMAPIFIGIFIILVLLAIINMFIAILTDFYEVAKEERSKWEQAMIELGDTEASADFNPGHIVHSLIDSMNPVFKVTHY